MIIAVDMFTEAMDEEKEGNGCHSRLQRTGLATLPGQGVGQARGERSTSHVFVYSCAVSRAT